MKTNIIIKIIGLLIFIILSHVSHAALDLKPTFESCSVYLPYENNVECKISFKKTSEFTWHSAYTPIYDIGKKEFRVSLVRLSENTDYQVKAELYSGGNKITEFTGTFTTWNTNVLIARTEDISKYKSGNVYVIDNAKGTATGWIKITSDKVLQTDYNAINEDDVVVLVKNSEYVILEGLTIQGGRRHAMCILTTCNNLRVVNCDISKWGRPVVGQTDGGQFLDKEGKEINHDAGIYLQKTLNLVIERCYIHDSKSRTNAWSGTVELGTFKGQKFSSAHPQGPNAIFLDEAKGGTIIRYNDLVGSQNHRYNDPVETADNSYWNGGFNKDADIYGNMIGFGQDDGIELDGGQNNVRTFGNRFEQTYCGISTAPNRQGPSYIFNNVVWNLGDSRPSTNVSVKNGGGDMVNEALGQYPGRNFFFNNTFIAPKNGITGVGYGDGTQREMFHATTRNNILISKTTPVNPSDDNGTGLCISDQHKTSDSDYDYDMLGNTSNANGSGTIWVRDGLETNAVFALPQFEDEAHGVFTLKAGDKAIDKGIAIPNYSEQYQSSAPDMGAFEKGASSLFPIRPLNISSDKYYVNLTSDIPTQKITLTIGDIGQETGFTIRKDDEMSWLEVVPNKTKIQSNTTLELTLKAPTTNGKQSGMMFLRLPDGFSVPITVVAETGEFQYPHNIVTTEADNGVGSLRQVIADSYNNDVILIPGDFIIRLDSAIQFDKTLKIKGQGATVQVKNPGVSPYKVFSIGNATKPTIAETVVLEDLTILGGDVSSFTTTDGASYGGAVFVNTSKSITMKNCTVANGKATMGGGLMTIHPSPRTVILENCIFKDNTATSNSGGCFLAGSAPVNVNHCSFINNLTNGSSSGLASKSISTNISDCYFKSNVANPGSRNGAALNYAFDNDKGTMQVNNTTFEENINYSLDGGAAFFGNESSTSGTVFTNCTFFKNTSSSGAVYDYNGNVVAINCTFAGNTGTGTQYGSAFYARDNAAVKFTLINNIIACNYGGKAAIYTGSKSVDTGTNNLIESYTGKSILNLQGALTFNPSHNLFSDYSIVNGKKIPKTDSITHTLPIPETSVAAQAGISIYTGFNIPTLDQRGKLRANPLCIGSYEYIPEILSETISPFQKKSTYLALNPVVDRLVINDIEAVQQFQIFNIDGKILLTQVQPKPIMTLDNIRSGLYVILFKTEKGNFYEKLFVK